MFNLSHEISEYISAGGDIRSWKTSSTMSCKDNKLVEKYSNFTSHPLDKMLVNPNLIFNWPV